MITSKQRAKLRGIANTIDTIFQVGKGGIVDTLVDQINDALKAREIVKIKVLDNAPVNSKDAATEVAEKTGAEIVQVIGTKFVVYKRNNKKPIIELD